MDFNIESRSTQMVRVRRFSHRFHRIHRNSCWGDSPTDFTEFTEVRVHPLKLAASEFRGGLFSFVLFVLFVFVSSQASGSVNSVKSVGEPTHPTNLCQSVQSVGEYSQAEGSVNSVNSVGEPTHQAEFVLFELFVFVSSQGYMCVSYIVLSDSNKFKLC